MTLNDLLAELAGRGIRLKVADNQLKVKAPKGALTAELRDALVARKHEVVAALAGQSDEAAGGLAPIARDEPLELSFAQQRLWFLVQMDPNSPVYNLPNVGELSGPLDTERLRDAINLLVARHEILRTTFELHKGRPVQRVAPSVTVDLPVHDLRDLPLDERDGAAKRLARDDAEQVFDLARGPLIRTSLLRLDDSRWWFLLSLHHIVSDGWSWTVILRELKAFYESGDAAQLPPLPVQFADYAAWELEQVDTPAMRRELAYWKERLGDEPSVLELPADHPRPKIVTYVGDTYPVQVPAALVARLRDIGQSHGATLFMTVLAAFQTLLHRYSGQTDIAVGTPIARRNQSAVEGLIGCFINSLVMRSDFASGPSFDALVQDVRDTCAEAYRRQDLPFEKLVEELQPERDLSHSPLFQAMLILHVQDKRRVTQFGDVAYRPLQVHSRSSKFDVTLELQETDEGLKGFFEYSTDLFTASTIERMAGHWLTLLESIVASPELPIGELALMPEAERRQLLVARNQSEQDWDDDRGVHQLIAAQAERRPDAVAVTSGDDTLTYQALDHQAGQLAAHLRSLDLGEAPLIAVYLPRGCDLVVALLGIAKAGAAYVPLDPSHPPDRLRYILEDAQVSALLTGGGLAPPACGEEVRIVDLDRDAEAIAESDGADLEVSSGPDDLAYVIYTSGSTGKPKGVMIEHGALSNFLHAMAQRPGLDADDTLLAVTTIAFDIAGLELYLPLVRGGRVHLADEAQSGDPRQLAALIDQVAPSVMQATPATWQMLLESGWSGSAGLKVLCGGEALPRPLANELVAVVGELWNVYGPTETTIWSAIARIEAGDQPISIGQPLANTQLYVLDERQRPSVTGAVGELYIGGHGLARGYLRRPELTAERFVQVDVPGRGPTRLYRTGDLVRYRDDRLTYIGRTDYQVKVRGFRIELGEIEHVLEQMDEIDQAIVVAKTFGENDQRLIGFAAQSAGVTLDVESAREHLRQRLPEYMIPSSILALDALPLTANGKVDRLALLALADTATPATADYVPPVTEMEQQVADIWQEVLGVERVGRHDNFFSLGGHSLLSMRVLARVEEQTGAVVSPKRIFTESLAEFSASCSEALTVPDSADAGAALTPVHRDDAMALSFAQQRIWFLVQMDPDSPVYNLPNVGDMRGPLDVERLHQCINALIARHEILRTTFDLVDGSPIQRAAPSLTLDLPVTDLTHLPEAEREGEAHRQAQAEAERVFDLSRGPLIRTSLIRLAEDRHWFLLTLHHIVSDGWSLVVLLRELKAMYESGLEGELPDLPVQFIDYAAWELAQVDTPSMHQELEYWKKRLGDDPAALEIPGDFPRPKATTYQGASHRLQVSAALTGKLRAIAESQGATLFMTLLAAFQTLLHRYSGQTDVSIGTPIARRNHAAVQPLIGCFINSISLRADLRDHPAFTALLADVRETAAEAYGHQDLPFERLVEELQPKRDLSRSPLFQAMLVLHVPDDQRVTAFGDVGYERVHVYTRTSKFDLTLELDETSEGLGGRIEYSTDLFTASTIERMAGHWLTLLESIVASPELPIGELALMPEAERRQLLVARNQSEQDWDDDRGVHQLIAAQAERRPDAVAVTSGDDTLTYQALDHQAGQLAAHLRSLDLGEAPLIAVYLPRGCDLVVALLGIAKAGAAYVPLDPSHPPDRLRYILEDAQVSALLTGGGLVPPACGEEVRIVDLDRDAEAIAESDGADLEVSSGPDDLAYVIYTSGSTGKPKGVMIEHGALSNFLHAMAQRPGLDADDTLLAVTTIAFDIAGLELYLPLVRGGRVHLADEAQSGDPRQLAALIDQVAPSVMQATPATWQMLLESGWSGSAGLKVLCGGEALPRPLANELVAVVGELWNVYGPTETTIWSAIARIEAGDQPISIGQPLANTQLYVLDERQRPSVTGAVGELYIGGHGLARGYLRRPELTAERFVQVDVPGRGPTRLYRTGDLVRYRDDRLTYIGRTDYQVKVRGFRIELGEIEHVLEQMDEIDQAIVVAKTFGDNDKRLIAFLLHDADRPASLRRVRKHLRARLPDYMVPSAIITLTEFPLTPNGKVDRATLIDSASPDLAPTAEFEPPETEMEQFVAGVWQEVLGVSQVGLNDNFFDLGGHSLLSMRVLARVQENTGHFVNPKEIFTQTLRQFAAACEEVARDPAPA